MNASMINKETAIKLAEKLAVPSHSDHHQFTELGRLNVIENELHDSPYSHVEKKDLFWLYSQKPIENMEGKLLIVSSHADCLQHKAMFKYSDEKHPKRMVGTFDNAITNAACVYLMKHTVLPENVVFAFTGEEERDQKGARELCKYLKKMNKAFKAMVLDCTYSAFEERADFTIENDFIYRSDADWMKNVIDTLIPMEFSWRFIPAPYSQKYDNPDEYIDTDEIIKMISVKKLCVEDGEIENADEDEAWEYDDRDISCFSVCLPCDAYDMHVEEGFGIRRNNYYNYISALHALCSVPVQ